MSSYKHILTFILLTLFGLTHPIFGQSDTSSMLDELLVSEELPKDFTKASFKTNKIINLHSIENTAPGVLDFKIAHRFGLLDQGLYDIFGLDQAQMRIGYDLGITDQLQIGGGRSNYEKIFDGYIKYKFLRQRNEKGKMPFSAALVVGGMIKTLKFSETDRVNYFSSRLYYNFHLLLARKFSEGFTLQLTPSLVHRNLVATAVEKNDVYALGIGARQKITRRLSLNLEYIYVLPDQLAAQYYNSASIGFDIETGGHVFQLHFTNSQGMNEKAFITETISNWKDWQFHFGFNLSRVFTLWTPQQKM